jgi:hypothetical protein
MAQELIGQHPRARRPGATFVSVLRALPLAVLAPGTAATAPLEADVENPFFAHAAACAAALEVDQLALVARARAGTSGLRDELVRTTVLGFTFVGTAYKRGLRNPRGDTLLNAARAEQRNWPQQRHEQAVASCRAEAARLFDDATSLERWLLTNRAAARVDRYLSASAASAPASEVRP